jgi:hypothetical protein
LTDYFAILPQSIESFYDGGFVSRLQKITKPFALRAAVHRIFLVVDINSEHFAKKIRETAVRKLQDIAANFPLPSYSVWEETIHRWIALPSALQHFPQGRK